MHAGLKNEAIALKITLGLFACELISPLKIISFCLFDSGLVGFQVLQKYIVRDLKLIFFPLPFCLLSRKPCSFQEKSSKQDRF